MTTAWRTVVFDALLDREWHTARELFSLVEKSIPSHYATRHMARMRGDVTVVRISDIDVGRFRYFAQYIGDIGAEIENKGPRNRLELNSKLRLRPAGLCLRCTGPIYQRSRQGRPFCPACRTFSDKAKRQPLQVKRRLTVDQVLLWVYQEQKADQQMYLKSHPDAVAIHNMIQLFRYPWAQFLVAYGRLGEPPELPEFHYHPVTWTRVRRIGTLVWKKRGKYEKLYDEDFDIHVSYTPIKCVITSKIDRLTAFAKIESYRRWYEAITEFSRLIRLPPLSTRLSTIEVI